MEEAFEFLEKLRAEIDFILEFEETETNQKVLLDKVLNIINQAVGLITIFDKDKIEDWKKNEKHSFLYFVPFLKNLLFNLNNYIKGIEPSLKHFYTDEIAEEIEILNQEIQKFQQELNSDFEEISIKEKEKLEHEYNTLQLLLTERDEIIKKNNILKSFDIKEIRKEINELTKKVAKIKAEIEPLEQKKEELHDSLAKFDNINKDINKLKNSQEQSSALLMAKIEESIKLIQEKHYNWQENKGKYLNRLEQELKNLTSTENEIRNYLSGLSSYRESIIKNKDIIEKHFTTNKKIVNSLPALKESITSKIEKLEEELQNLDSEIRKFLEIKQKISDDITRNPISFDYS